MEAAPFDHAAALNACARGDEAAFHQLYDYEAPHMLALCQRLVPASAENLLHDTFALLWRNADQYDAVMGPARPWIYNVLRHVANSYRMRQNAVPPLSAPALPPASAIRGHLAQLADNGDPFAYEAIAHAYLHGADYPRLSVWMRQDAALLKKKVRQALEELSA
ncbi:MAG: hypothetical protein GX772_07560 [Alcaligenaceae bacterium]|nr:hypothetical protein [Alcaligenaceae bacterium]